ncbi:hypothetical protein PITCH_A230012 [uncultured Desulfobacterium sp.]|uniref:Uncharacterized protein n=1 Tax=uncultured Desulfobacterium sp. TaxID=201089 RepID=A0A445MXW2_9BACT|nr:hypothetical protein PITCH_A230012 [uncultured Desulfobacterium sp.]
MIKSQFLGVSHNFILSHFLLDIPVSYLLLSFTWLHLKNLTFTKKVGTKWGHLRPIDKTGFYQP